MLELKRKVGQTVRLGTETQLTVSQLTATSATLILERPDLHLVAPVLVGRHHDIEVEGHPVQIHLLDVVRGEARLGFIAPRELSIERPEREAKP